MKASLILPLCNSEKYIIELIKCIKAQEFTDYELIVLDDCSKDKTRSRLNSLNVNYIQNDTRLGFSKNINKGVKLAKGEYIFLLDHDIYYPPDYVSKMMNTEGDIISGRSYYYHLRGKIRALNIKVNLLITKTFIIGRDEEDRGQYDKLREIDAMGMGNLMIKKEVFGQIGLFDENLTMYFVDVDFCKRAKKRGFRIVLSDAKSYHKKMEKDVLTQEQKKTFIEDKRIFIRKYSKYFIIPRIIMKLNEVKGY